MLGFDYPFPARHEDDLAIPRTRLVDFEIHFRNQAPLGHVEYLYRLDYLQHQEKSDVSFRGRCLTAGHQYRDQLGNVLKYRGLNLAYIDEVSNLIADLENQNLCAQRLYFFPTLQGAKIMQMKSIQSDPSVEMNQQGDLDFVHNPLNMLQNLGIISRVQVEDMPEGSYFPDPNTPDDPTAALHIVGSATSVTIPPESIQFCINDRWVTHRAVDSEAIEESANRGNIRSIICGIE